MIHMYDGTMKRAEDISADDVLMTPSGLPTTVKTIRTTPVHGEQEMVQLEDFYITKGHPIYKNGKSVSNSIYGR